MSDYSCRVERMTNGYSVRLTDPKIQKANDNPNRKGSWRDPSREFVFTDIDKVLEFLKKNLNKALPQDDFDSAFAEVSAKDDNDGDE